MSDSPTRHHTSIPEEIALDVILQERSAIGGLVHNTLCQSLSGIALMVNILAGRARAGQPIDVEEFDALALAVKNAVAEAKQISKRLAAIGEDAENLMEALAQLAKDSSASIPCDFQCEEPILVTDVRKAAVLFRVAEEAIQQALHHSHASHIAITLAESAGKVVLTVRCDGCAAKGESTPDAERARHLLHAHVSIAGGTLDIASVSPSSTIWTSTISA